MRSLLPECDGVNGRALLEGAIADSHQALLARLEHPLVPSFAVVRELLPGLLAANRQWLPWR